MAGWAIISNTFVKQYLRKYNRSEVETLHVCRLVQCPGCLGGVTVRASDLQSSSRGFDSRSGRYQAT